MGRYGTGWNITLNKILECTLGKLQDLRFTESTYASTKGSTIPHNRLGLYATCGAHSVLYFRPPCRLGKACGEACPSRLVASGGGLSGGCKPDSPSRNGTLLLLRVAARLRRGGRVGSHVVR